MLDTWKPDCHNRVEENTKDLSTCTNSKNVERKPTLLRLMFGFIIFVICLTGRNADSSHCLTGLTTPGRTWPQGDIVLEYKQPLEILCILNEPSIGKEFSEKNASDLVFLRNNKLVESEFINIVNETTIRMYVRKPPVSESIYYCKLQLDEKMQGVCLNKVVIGYKPQKPENFSCISYNWENLTCTWDPLYNPIATTFDLSFKIRRQVYLCPTQGPVLHNKCVWSTTTNPLYRQPWENYSFTLNASNFLGNASFSYKVQHYKHVIPAKPDNLTVINKTSSSAFLTWSVPFPLQNFPPGLDHKIKYQNEWDLGKNWKEITIRKNKNETMFLDLTGLEYANTVYDVRVYIRSADAMDDENMWSAFSDVTFRTLPKVPGSAPRTDIGSFEIIENKTGRDVYLYWQAIPLELQNGYNFTYKIVGENGRELSLLPSEITGTYAMFKGLTFDSYKFEIMSMNEVGANPNRAKIFLPSRNEILKEPKAFTKIDFDNGLYELSWAPPTDNQDIVDYTVFWCDNKQDRPYQCVGYLDWVRVPKNMTIYNVTVANWKGVYQFAISANSKKTSSGMVWASCTVIHKRNNGKMKSVWINSIGSTFIEVGWKLDCSDRIGIIEGFNIYYCPIIAPHNVDCKGSKLNMTIKADSLKTRATLKNLKPYTTYMVAVAFLTKKGESLHSGSLYNTTLEAAPTSPCDVKVFSITNTSMHITWKEPEAINGLLRYYEVHYNDRTRRVEAPTQELELEDLLPHHNYSIRIAACTVSCGSPSPTIDIVTNVGVPGKIETVQSIYVNHTLVRLDWKPPQNPAGYLDYYEILLNNEIIKISNATWAILPTSNCHTIGNDVGLKLQLRAVNKAPDGTVFEGPWSEIITSNCVIPILFGHIITWIMIILGTLLVFLCLAYTIKRIWLTCKDMQDVEVKLPPGLAPNMKLLEKVGDQHARQSSADSSGCSSGQESVTSSLTSDSQVSSDSGTEVDPSIVSQNKLLETPSWESSSLRQRNVGTFRPSLTTETARWEPCVKVSKCGDNILTETLSLARSTPNLTDNTSCANSQQTWSSTGYISMPSNEELSNNSSPVPKECSNVGCYSVIGQVPRPIKSNKSNSNENVVESKCANPYVTLASLEEKSKVQKNSDYLDNIGELQLEGKKKFISNIDRTSKPYVQAGLIDTGKKSSFNVQNNYSLTSSTDSCKTPFVSAFVNPSGTSSQSKPYVTVAAISDITKTFQPTVVSPAMNVQSKPYVTVFQMLQLQEKEKILSSDSEIEDFVDENVNNEERTKDHQIPVPRGSGYVTFAENPKLGPRVTSTTGQSSDEPYSKVTVVPSTMH